MGHPNTLVDASPRVAGPSLADKVVVITGASSGIGRSTARALSHHGSKLVLVAQNEERLDAVRADLPDDTMIIPADVSAPGASENIVDRALARYGQIDAVFANAGIFVNGKVEETEFEAIRRCVDINVYAAFSLVRAVLPHFTARKRGDVLLTSSIAGHQALASEPVYSATKHAVRAFTHALRRQIAGSGVRVAEISPGIVLTDLWGYAEGDPRVAGRLEEGTGIQAEDVADAVHFMLSRPPHVTIRDLVILPTNQNI